MIETKIDALIEDNRNYLMPFSYSLTQDQENAKDLVQETIYRAILNKDKYQSGTNIKAWLYTIMRNIFINNYRRAKKFKTVSSDVPQDYYMAKTNRTAANDGVMNTSIAEIKKAIDEMPEIFRIAFEMHYLGYKYHEIAETLNEPLGTIKSRIHFARKILIEKLK